MALLPVLEAVVRSGKPLLIIAEGVEGEALAMRPATKKGAASTAPLKHPHPGIRLSAKCVHDRVHEPLCDLRLRDLSA